ncbi:hypothetical protein EYB53_025155 [Candidatus Chloroploca sp. M-50]|uniref:Secreted protein n=1 Tax=Candidatus Chloroploca mongolica TaxID=2528176 RepID=A0ABS4DHY0_9CHLR|nr:hypothetical protein [Candidatus Chloroploca mongolica]MBP1469022.1 hypothetical protein [Candidatus Chloroploca mongolica]
MSGEAEVSIGCGLLLVTSATASSTTASGKPRSSSPSTTLCRKPGAEGAHYERIVARQFMRKVELAHRARAGHKIGAGQGVA